MKNRKFFLPLLDSNSFSSPALVLVIAKIEKLGDSLHQLKQNKTDFFSKRWPIIKRKRKLASAWRQGGNVTAFKLTRFYAF